MGRISVSQEKSDKHLSLKIYPVVVGVMGVAIALLLIGRQWTVPGPESSRSPDTVDPSRLPPEIPLVPSEVPTGSPTTEELGGSASPAAINPSDGIPTSLSSNLRVSNRTNHPIRVALLAQQPNSDTAAKANPAELPPVDMSYEEPAHWDFAPGEGSRQGLILSLPDEPLQLQSGDVLVAFAQDGSRLYWGPYVVGSTSLPRWNESTQEWQLILEP